MFLTIGCGFLRSGPDERHEQIRTGNPSALETEVAVDVRQKGGFAGYLFDDKAGICPHEWKLGQRTEELNVIKSGNIWYKKADVTVQR